MYLTLTNGRKPPCGETFWLFLVFDIGSLQTMVIEVSIHFIRLTLLGTMIDMFKLPWNHTLFIDSGIAHLKMLDTQQQSWLADHAW